MKRIIILSGKRGGYEAMRPLMQLLSKSNFFDLKIILTDQHFEKNFGNTYKYVYQDFNKSEIIPLKFKNKRQDTNFSRTESLLYFGNKLVKKVKKLSPDIIVLYGDRSEVAIAALILFTLGVPIIHLQGGDVSGSLDNTYRHVISKFSNIHLVSNYNSKKNLLKMAEINKFIHIVGDHHLDNLKDSQLFSKKYILEKYKIKKKILYCFATF